MTSQRPLQSRWMLLLCGMALGAGVLGLWIGFGRGDGEDRLMLSFPSILREASADLENGEFDFFANRRSIWVVNRTNGRMANYVFRDDELGSVDRSRVATIDLKTFPSKDTSILLSDRNLNNILWVCNRRTGDVQMWSPGRDGVLRAETPVATSTDLMDRPVSAPR